MIGLLSVILVCSLATVNIVFKQSTEHQIQKQLTIAKQVFARLLDVKSMHLSENAFLLSSDFSFKQVIATKDKATILSALDNLIIRIDADTAILVSTEQQVLADTNNPENNQLFFAPELIEQAQQQGSSNSIVLVNDSIHQMLITPIMAPELKAWLCVSFKINQIQLNELKQLTQAHISLLSVFGHNPPQLKVTSLSSLNKNTLITIMPNFDWQNNKPFSVQLEGRNYITSTLTIPSIHQGSIIAVVQKSLDEELLPFYRLQGILLLIALASLLLTFMGSLWVARSVSRPIKTLVSGVREVGKGNYDYYIEVDRNDEIGELGLAFNEMAREHKLQVFLRQAKETAESASQAKTNFLAKMSHELRSPLNSIIGYAQLLQKPNFNPSQQSKALLTIEQSGNHLLLLINEILDLSKIESGQLQLQNSPFNLIELLHHLFAMMLPRAANKGLKLNAQFKIDAPCWVNRDQQRLRQILMNLLDNAVKYTDKGSINFNVSSDNDIYSFSIEDTGMGIPEDDLKDIFISFHQLHQSQGYVEGTGLGLAICNQLVQLLGGKLKVHSTLTEGSQFRFVVRLPKVEQIAERINTGQQTEFIPSIATNKMNYPAKHFLLRLLSFAQQGDIQNIQRLNLELNQSQTNYADFSQQLKNLVDDFKINQIRQLLTDAIQQIEKKHDN